MARVICQILHRPDRVTFIWSEGSTSFAPYRLEGDRVDAFRRRSRRATELLAEVAGRGNALAGDLARIGWELYQAVFPDEPLAMEIRGWLNDLAGKNAVESLEIVSDLPGSTPWNIVYEQPPDDALLASGQPQAFRPFWGVRYPLTTGRRVSAWRQLPRLESPLVLIVADPLVCQELPEAERDRLTNLARDKELQVIESKSALTAAFQEQPPDFVYVFGGYVADGFMLGQDLVSLGELRDLVHGGEAEALVFLNLARTAAAEPSAAHFERLLSSGMDGVIASTQPGPAAEANALGLEFLADFVYGGEPLGATLQRLRGRTGAAGLLISSACPAGLRVAWEEEAAGGDTGLMTEPQSLPLPEYPYRPLAAYDREDRALFTGRYEDVADFVSRLDHADTRLLLLHGVSGAGKASFLHAGVVPFLEDEAVGFRALRDRTPVSDAHATEPDAQAREGSPSLARRAQQTAERDYPVIAIRATHDLAGQLAEAISAFCSQPYSFTTPIGKTTTVDLPGILRGLIGAQEGGQEPGVRSQESGIREQRIGDACAVTPDPWPLTPASVWEALQNDPGLLARILTALSEPLPGELVILIEQGEEVFTQATRAVDRRRRRQALDMLGRAAATPGRYKLIYSLRTEYLGRLLDELPAHGQASAAFLLGELADDQIIDAILLPTIAEPIPYADQAPQEKYHFSYAEGVAEMIVKNAREAGNGSESLLPRVQAICAQLYDMLGDRTDRVVSEPDLNLLGKGNLPFQLGAYVEKKLGFLPQRGDRKKFVSLLQQFYRSEPDGTVVRKLVPLGSLADDWRGSVPLDDMVEGAAADNVRLFELNQLLIGGKEGLYVSLGQDALAQAARQLTEDRQRLSYGRSKMIDMLWVFVPLLFLATVLIYLAMQSRTAGGEQESFTKEEVQKLFRKAEKQFQEQAAEMLGYPMYIGRMSLADRALQSDNTLRARQLLLSQQASEKSDLRGFEWFYLWRRTQQEDRSLLGHKGLISSVAVTTDGKLIASASVDGTVKLWDVGGNIRATLEGHKGVVNAVAFAADGKTLASTGEDKMVRLWDVPPAKEYAVIKKPRAALSGHQGPVLALAFAPDSLTLASAGLDKSVILWNVTKGEKERELKEHAAPVRALAFAPDGKTLASAGDDRTVYVWDKTSGKRETLTGHAGPVFALAFSQDGERLASGGVESKDNLEVGTARLWDVKTRKLVVDHIPHAAGVFALAFGPGGKTLFSGGKDSSIRVWDTTGGGALAALHGHLGWVRSLALAGGTLISGSYDQTVKVWTPATALAPDVLRGHKGAVCSVVFSPDDKILASAGHDGAVRLWNTDHGSEVKTITSLGGPILALAFAPAKDRPRLAAATWNGQGPGTIKIWELVAPKDKTGLEVKELHTLKAHAGGSACLAFSHDGKTLVSGGADHTCILWEIASGKEKHLLKGHQGVLRALGFSLDDKLLASAGDDKVIHVWDVNSGKEKRAPLEGHTGPITALAYFPKDLLITAGYDQTIRFWSSQGKNVAMLRGHAGPILSLALDVKTGSIFSGSWDGSVKAWELRPGADERFTFTGHTGPVRSLAFSHDGRTLASAANDGTIRLWRAADPGVLGPEH